MRDSEQKEKQADDPLAWPQKPWNGTVGVDPARQDPYANRPIGGIPAPAGFPHTNTGRPPVPDTLYRDRDTGMQSSDPGELLRHRGHPRRMEVDIFKKSGSAIIETETKVREFKDEITSIGNGAVGIKRTFKDI